MINRERFYLEVKKSLFGGTITTTQVDIMEAILNECEAQEVNDIRQIAYCMATCYHECYNWNLGYKGRMVQLKEMGGEKYLKSKKYYPFYGRNPSHLTWKSNYEKEGQRLGLDLVKNPDIMLDINIGANSHVYCMKNGTYTSHKLSDYINANECDFKGARKIINPKDFKTFETVAGYAEKFLAAMS